MLPKFRGQNSKNYLRCHHLVLLLLLLLVEFMHVVRKCPTDLQALEKDQLCWFLQTHWSGEFGKENKLFLKKNGDFTLAVSAKHMFREQKEGWLL